MKALIENARIAWNPIAAVRDRFVDGTLNVSAVIIPFLGVVIACNLFAVGAQAFFFQSLEYGLNAGGFNVDITTDNPLIQNEFSQQVMSSIGVLVPAFVVYLLPAGVFSPAGRSATVAALLIVAAAWAFYGAAINAPVYFVAGALATADPQTGMMVFNVLAVVAIVVIFALTLFFFVRALSGELGLGGASILLIAAVYLASFGTAAFLVLKMASIV